MSPHFIAEALGLLLLFREIAEFDTPFNLLQRKTVSIEVCVLKSGSLAELLLEALASAKAETPSSV
jgi:hypothetical protein